MKDTFSELYEVVMSRKEEKQEGSYTCYLFEKGLDKILKKVGEECSETIIAAKNADMFKDDADKKSDLIGEISCGFCCLDLLLSCFFDSSLVVRHNDRCKGDNGNQHGKRTADNFRHSSKHS